MSINVLSTFDGISCGRVALQRSNIDVNNYYSSEVDKYALRISNKNHPSTIELGSIVNCKDWDLTEIDLVIGGSPCQSISTLGDGSGLSGSSGLFYSFVDCLSEYNPRYFLLENVCGNKKAINIINNLLGVVPIKINSNLLSAQNRNRLYWTNIPKVNQPENIKVSLKDILEEGLPSLSVLSSGRKRWLLSDNGQQNIRKRYSSIDPEKAACLTARSDASWNSNYVTREGQLTRLTPIEYERLQTLPDDYTEGVSTHQRYKLIGNSWTVDVISHIFNNLPPNYKVGSKR